MFKPDDEQARDARRDDLKLSLAGAWPHWENQLAKAKREGVIEGLQRACGLLQATVPVEALVHIHRELERLRAEQKEG